MNSIERVKLPIGFMDSGLGGLSVLKEAVSILPCEDFIYYGDSANAPYGTTSRDENHTTLAFARFAMSRVTGSS